MRIVEERRSDLFPQTIYYPTDEFIYGPSPDLDHIYQEIYSKKNNSNNSNPGTNNNSNKPKDSTGITTPNKNNSINATKPTGSSTPTKNNNAASKPTPTTPQPTTSNSDIPSGFITCYSYTDLTPFTAYLSWARFVALLCCL